MENNPTWLPVVAAALKRNDGLWLMQQRPLNKHHGGLWEFPGGKVESGETPPDALIREVREELDIGIEMKDCIPLAFAHSAGEPLQLPIVILLYKIDRWDGAPCSREGGTVGWYTPAQMGDLAKPPLDQQLWAHIFG